MVRLDHTLNTGMMHPTTDCVEVWAQAAVLWCLGMW